VVHFGYSIKIILIPPFFIIIITQVLTAGKGIVNIVLNIDFYVDFCALMCYIELKDFC